MNPVKKQKSNTGHAQSAASLLIAILFAAFAAGCAGNADKKTSEEEQATPPAETAEPSDAGKKSSENASANPQGTAADTQTHTATAWPTGALAAPAEEPVQPVAAPDQPAEVAKPAEEIDELPKREIRDGYQQNPTRWINESWKKRTTWPHEKEELESEAFAYAKKNYLSLYLKDAKVETVIDANAQTGTVTFNRGKGKSALCVVSGSNGKPERHYFRVL